MCGIIGSFHTKKDAVPANGWAIDQYEDQHSRGEKGFGIIGWKVGGKVEVLRATESAKFMYDLHSKPWQMMIVHHRWPTSTPNKLDQTHPLFVSHGSLKFDYLVVHNGVIRNEDKLRKTHVDELGFTYRTEIIGDKTLKFNDSESFAIEVARFVERQSEEIGTEGSAAFIAVQLEKTGKNAGKPIMLYFGRNEGNPLCMGKSRGKLHLSSEGEGDLIKPFILYSCAPSGEMDLKQRPMTFVKPAPVPKYAWERDHKTGAQSQLPVVSKPPVTPSYAPKSSYSGHGHHGYIPMDDDDEYNRWRNLEDQRSTPPVLSGGGFDDKQDDVLDEEVFDIDMQSLCQDIASEVDDAVTEFMEELMDPDGAGIVTPEETIHRIRQILEAAKDKALDLHLEMMGVKKPAELPKGV